MKTLWSKKENNLLQSDDWLAFQKSYGRTVVSFGNFAGIKIALPFGRSFIWVQKGPDDVKKELIERIAKENNAIFVRVEPGATPNGNNIVPVRKRSLLSGQTSPKATMILNITASEDQILAGMKPKTRYNIKLAEKKGVKVETLLDVDVFYELLTQTANRDKGYVPHDKDYYAKMLKELGPKERVKVFAAQKDGEYLAAIMVGFCGALATYLHGGFSEKYRNLMAPYLCQWEAIKYAKSKGCQYYDFWGVAETDDPNDPWAGITRFKEGFGGEKVIYRGAYDIVISDFWYNLFTFGAKVKHLIKK